MYQKRMTFINRKIALIRSSCVCVYTVHTMCVRGACNNKHCVSRKQRAQNRKSRNIMIFRCRRRLHARCIRIHSTRRVYVYPSRLAHIHIYWKLKLHAHRRLVELVCTIWLIHSDMFVLQTQTETPNWTRENVSMLSSSSSTIPFPACCCCW